MWYHISNKYLGDSPILQPRLPRNGYWKIIREEGNIPRICVSNSLFHCLLAIHGTEYLKSSNLEFKENPCVYFTEETPYLPPACSDFRQNGEMWFIKKTRFFYLARININYLFTHGVIIPTTEKDLILPEKPKTLQKVKTKFMSMLMCSKNETKSTNRKKDKNIEKK